MFEYVKYSFPLSKHSLLMQHINEATNRWQQAGYDALKIIVLSSLLFG